MKLRLLDDSVRLRLTRSEVERLTDQRRVVAQTRFGGGTLTYAVELSERVERPTARLVLAVAGVELTVRLPEQDGLAWAQGEAVGLHGEQTVDGATLCLAVEKDFRCLTPRNEDEDPDDAYPHPRAEDEIC